MTRNTVTGGRDQPAHHHPALAGPRHGDELAVQRPAHLGQVERDLSAPGLGDQADRCQVIPVDGFVAECRDPVTRRALGGTALGRGDRLAGRDPARQQHHAGRQRDQRTLSRLLANRGGPAADQIGDLPPDPGSSFSKGRA